MRQKLQRFVYRLCEETDSGPGRYFNLLMMGLILIAISVWLLESNNGISESYGAALKTVENAAIISFMAEYILRMIAYQGPFWRYMLQPLAVVDMLAIVPFFVTAGNDLIILRVLRLFRIFRLIKLVRYSEAVRGLILVFRMNSSVLAAFLFVIVVILFLSAALMQSLEPGRFMQFTDALWWSIVTLTTVGYGDIVPESLPGKLVAGVLMIFGIGIIALPTGVLGASMTKLMLEDSSRKGKECPRCGEQEHLAVARYCHRCGDRLRE
ncbi:MAG: ion transporter [Turneriella sp.]